MPILGRLQGNTPDRTDNCTEITGHAALATIGVAGEDDPSSPPGGQVGFLLRVEDGLSPPEEVQEYGP
jgi:hypothetical protein